MESVETYITIGLWNYLEKWSNEMQMKYIKKGLWFIVKNTNPH